MIQALGSASCDITHETGATTSYVHWVLRLVNIRDRRYELLRALESASSHVAHETGGTVCYVYWIQRLVISPTRQDVRFVMGIGFCVL